MNLSILSVKINLIFRHITIFFLIFLTYIFCLILLTGRYRYMCCIFNRSLPLHALYIFLSYIFLLSLCTLTEMAHTALLMLSGIETYGRFTLFVVVQRCVSRV